MRKHLVLVGGGHAHMVTLANICAFVEKGYDVTVVGPSEYHYYSGMGPGMLGGFYRPEEIRFNTRHVVEKQGGVFVTGRVTRVDPNKNILFLAGGGTITYNVVSFNAGSYVPWPVFSGGIEDVYSVKPIEKLYAARERLLALFQDRKIVVSIIGGGPSALEVAGNVWRLARKSRHKPIIKVYAGSGLMSKYSGKIQILARDSLISRGIEIIAGAYIEEMGAGSILLNNGENVATDFTFIAMGIQPSAIFSESGLPVGRDGGLLVNKYLQSEKYPNIFGGGDCICFKPKPLDKVGVYAVRENPVLYNNLMASLDEGKLQEFKPGRSSYLLIYNLGNGKGLFKKGPVTYAGRTAFLFKDHLDRKFMKRFQALEKEG